jgi:GT2 family glycosyltransferase
VSPARAYPYAPPVDPVGVAGTTSVVVVHYRGIDDLRACVDSVLSQDAGDIELILVDNASPDGGVSSLPDHPSLRRVFLPRNVGFAAGVNAGLAVATGDVIVLLNPDAALRRGCIAALRGGLVEADIAVPRVLLAADPARLDSCGHELFPDGLNWCRGRGESAAGRFEEPEDLLLFSGAAVALRRDGLARVGGLDEGFWAYGEDADLGLRAARAGLRCRSVPAAVVVHRVGGSFGAYGLRKAFLVERNRVRVALVHLPLAWLVVAPGWTVARVVGLALLGGAGRGVAGGYPPGQRTLLVPTVLAAWAAAALQAPASMARRWALARDETDPAFVPRLSAARIGVRTLLRRPSPLR